MDLYFELLATEIFKDYENFSKIYDQYIYGTWIIICLLFLIHLIGKYVLLTLPLWLPLRIVFSNIQFKNKTKQN